MNPTRTDPINIDWPDLDARATTTAADVSGRLARMEIADIRTESLPFLAAAAAELASVAGIPWRFSTDDAAVALLRVIAKATIACPDASGPHAARLLDHLP